MAPHPRDQQPLEEAVVRADRQGNPHDLSAVTLEVLQPEELLLDQACQALPRDREGQLAPLTVGEGTPEELLQLLDLAAVLGLADGVVRRGTGNSPSGGHLQEGMEPFQRDAPFAEEILKHGY